MLTASTGTAKQFIIITIMPADYDYNYNNVDDDDDDTDDDNYDKNQKHISNAIQVQIVRTPDTAMLPCTIHIVPFISIYYVQYTC